MSAKSGGSRLRVCGEACELQADIVDESEVDGGAIIDEESDGEEDDACWAELAKELRRAKFAATRAPRGRGDAKRHKHKRQCGGVGRSHQTASRYWRHVRRYAVARGLRAQVSELDVNPACMPHATVSRSRSYQARRAARHYPTWDRSDVLSHAHMVRIADEQRLRRLTYDLYYRIVPT